MAIYENVNCDSCHPDRLNKKMSKIYYSANHSPGKFHAKNLPIPKIPSLLYDLADGRYQRESVAKTFNTELAEITEKRKILFLQFPIPIGVYRCQSVAKKN